MAPLTYGTVHDEPRQTPQGRMSPRRRSFIGDNCSVAGVGKQGHRGVAGVAIVLYKTITGSGVLAMPFAIHQAGSVMFPLMVLLVALCSHYGCLLLNRGLDMLAREGVDYAEMGTQTMGRFGFYLVLAVCFLDSWGAAVGAFSAIAEILSPILQKHSLLGSSYGLYGSYIIWIVAALIYPAMLYKKVTELGWINVLSVLAMFVFVVVLVLVGFCNQESISQEATFSTDFSALASVTVVAFSFDCQSNVFGSYRDIKGRTGFKAGRLNVASAWANGLAAATYIVISLAGYAAFGTSTCDNVLKNFYGASTGSHWYYDPMKVFFAVSIWLSFPVMLIEASTIVREQIVTLWWERLRAAMWGNEEEADSVTESPAPPPDVPAVVGEPEEPTKTEQWLNAFTSLVILGTAALTADAISSMLLAFQYVGATTATCNTVILPALLYLAAVRKVHPNEFVLARFFPENDPSVSSPLTHAQLRAHDPEAKPLYDSDEEGDLAGTGGDGPDRLTIISPPPHPFWQYCALLYLICGVLALPTLVWITVESGKQPPDPTRNATYCSSDI
eukprot:TRINITY_DN28430_c0_g1_i1.p1 TRINITY_DN28430_c0_g1~~TRINITY_DN28430_c0_g1_i1.p1  ORF type:complete len:558 (+),score=149.11 TRINITY_DN28430_c0_g1_i1:63-1736(+)